MQTLSYVDFAIFICNKTLAALTLETFYGGSMVKLIISKSVFKKENLALWRDQFALGTAGYRDLLSPEDWENPDVPFNRVKVAIILEAFGQLMQRKNKKSVHVGGEVRYHTRAFIDLAVRIFSAKGINVYLKPENETCPIWLSSFGTFYYDLDYGLNFTASHSPFFKGGIKPMDSQGMQLLDEAAEIEAIVKEICQPGLEIDLGEPGQNVKNTFQPEKIYANYLKGLIGEKALQRIRQGKLRITISTVGGAMGVNAKKIFRLLNLPFGPDEPIKFIHSEEDPEFHKIGQVDGKNVGPDPGKPEVYMHIGAQTLLRNNETDVVFIWDPDGDRFNFITTMPLAMTDKATQLGLKSEPLDDDRAIVFFNPNQIYFMLTAEIIGRMKADKQLDDFDWIVMETFPTSRSITEVARKNGLKTFLVPVGFKHFGQVTAAVENQMDDGENSIVLENVLGDKTELSGKPRVLIMAEESGGAAMGSSSFILSQNGRKSIALKEKDAMQIGVAAMSLINDIKAKDKSVAEYYIDLLETNDIKYRYYHREDVVLYDESIVDPEKRQKAKMAGFAKRDRLVGFFKALAEAHQNGNKSLADIRAELQSSIQTNALFDEVKNIFWAGDGTFIEFLNYWFELRASGTDALLRYYLEGNSEETLNSVLQGLLSIEG
jgi:phosphomannomutase